MRNRTDGHGRESKSRKSKPEKEWGRKIHFGDEIWRYKITGSGIKIQDPENRRTFVEMTEITGWNWDDLERADWKGYTPQVKPSHIKRYIKKHLRGVHHGE